MSSHHIVQGGDGFCVPEMNVLWREMNESTAGQKQNTGDAGWSWYESVIMHSEMNPVLTWTERSRSLSQEEALRRNTTYKKKKVRLHFENAKLNCLAIMTVVSFRGTRGKLASLRTPS